MGLREDLARDIHRAGVTSPDLLAEYLIERGWVMHVPFELGGTINLNEIAVFPSPDMVRMAQFNADIAGSTRPIMNLLKGDHNDR